MKLTRSDHPRWRPSQLISVFGRHFGARTCSCLDRDADRKADGAKRLAWVVRWIARLWTVVTIGVVALLSLGEGVHPAGPVEAIGLVLYPGGICVGLIVALWREKLGGGVTVGSLLAFYVLHTATAGIAPMGWAWLALAVPGFLFLWLSGHQADEEAERQ